MEDIKPVEKQFSVSFSLLVTTLLSAENILCLFSDFSFIDVGLKLCDKDTFVHVFTTTVCMETNIIQFGNNVGVISLLGIILL